MLGRKEFTQEELEGAKAAVAAQLAAYRRLEGPQDAEPALFNGLVLALDRRFVHRLRSVTGKAGTPLNELELIAEALLNHDGVLHAINVIKYEPESSVLGIEVGDRVELTADDFERLAEGVFAELEEKYVSGSRVPASRA
jgi:hypothetical protein